MSQIFQKYFKVEIVSKIFLIRNFSKLFFSQNLSKIFLSRIFTNIFFCRNFSKKTFFLSNIFILPSHIHPHYGGTRRKAHYLFEGRVSQSGNKINMPSARALQAHKHDLINTPVSDKPQLTIMAAPLVDPDGADLRVLYLTFTMCVFQCCFLSNFCPPFFFPPMSFFLFHSVTLYADV